MKTCAGRRVSGSPQAPAMRFYDRAADAKSHAGPMRFRCKKRAEHLIRLLWRKSYTGITDGHENLFFLRPLRIDGKFPRTIPLLTPVDAIYYTFHNTLYTMNSSLPY